MLHSKVRGPQLIGDFVSPSCLGSAQKRDRQIKEEQAAEEQRQQEREVSNVSFDWIKLSLHRQTGYGVLAR